MQSSDSWEPQWLGLCAFTAKDPGSNPGQGTKTPQVTGEKKKNNYGNLELPGTISPHGKSLPEIKPNPEEIKIKMWGVRDRKTPSHRKKRIWMTIFEP